MTRSALLLGGALPLAVVLQSTLLHAVGPGGSTPDLVLLLVLAAAYRGGLALGAAAGFWGGLLIGAARGYLAGPMSFIYLTLGAAAGSYLQTARRPALDLPLMACGFTVMAAVLELVAFNLLGAPCRLDPIAIGRLTLVHGTVALVMGPLLESVG